MKHLLLAFTLTLTATAAMAHEVIEVEVVTRHCQEQDTSNLTGQINTKAEAQCQQMTGYPNAKLIGAHSFKSRVISFGYPGCSLIKNTTISGKYECLTGNK
jgi:hypothetical protein